MTVYVISDLHFDDEWICSEHRRFDDVETMNETLLENCKAKVSEDDSLLFLGDIVGSEGTEQDMWVWYGNLTEIDCWVLGNHDPMGKSAIGDVELPLHPPFSEEISGHKFHFNHRKHRGENMEEEGWLVHGHVHNQHLNRDPFIDPGNKTVNVSASVIGYEPIAMDRIVDLVEKGQQYKVAPWVDPHS